MNSKRKDLQYASVFLLAVALTFLMGKGDNLWLVSWGDLIPSLFVLFIAGDCLHSSLLRIKRGEEEGGARWSTCFTTSHGAIPAPLNYEGFPKSVCTSINDVVCHGIPNKNEILKSGDIINVDVSTIYKGYFSDASRMFMIGDVNPDMQRLVQVTKECMEIGIAAAQPWKQLGDVGAAIQEHAEKNGFSVVRDLCGHGVGMQFHEEPDVEHFGRRGTGMMIVPGMTFTIEPMINMGTYEVFIDDADGWTVCTDDGLPSAQWENMILITETGNEILTY